MQLAVPCDQRLDAELHRDLVTACFSIREETPMPKFPVIVGPDSTSVYLSVRKIEPADLTSNINVELLDPAPIGGQDSESIHTYLRFEDIGRRGLEA
jgi:hypothetical protein